MCDRTRTPTRPWNTNADTTRLGKTWGAISGFQAVETQHSPMEWKVRCRACDPMSGGFLYCFWPWFDTVSIMQNAPGKKPALHWPSYAVNQWFLPFGFSNSPNSVATLKGFLRWGLRPGVWSRWYPARAAFFVNFHTNGSCEMSMCVSTAQARTKCLPRNRCPAFFQ